MERGFPALPILSDANILRILGNGAGMTTATGTFVKYVAQIFMATMRARFALYIS